MSNTNTCCVCGRFSTRSVWNNTLNTVDGNGYTTTYVACDFHSLQEIEDAVNALTGLALNPVVPDVTNIDPSVTEAPQT